MRAISAVRSSSVTPSIVFAEIPNLKSFGHSHVVKTLALADRKRRQLRLTSKLRARSCQLLLLFSIDFRKREVELFDGVHNSRGNQKSGEPFVVGRHDIPRGIFRSRGADRLLEGVHVVEPKFTLVDIGGRKLPVLFRIVEPLHEAILLFFARHVEKEFEDDSPLADKVVLEMCNVGKPLVPDAFAHERGRQFLALEYFLSHTDDQYLFVV